MHLTGVASLLLRLHRSGGHRAYLDRVADIMDKDTALRQGVDEALVEVVVRVSRQIPARFDEDGDVVDPVTAAWEGLIDDASTFILVSAFDTMVDGLDLDYDGGGA